MQQASCLEGGPLLWIWPLYLHVNQKSDDDDDDDLFYCKIKHRKNLEHKISWKVLNFFAQKCTNDDIGLTLTF